MKQLFIFGQFSPRLDVLFLLSISRYCSGLILSVEHTGVRKNLLLNACRFCYDRHSLREMDQTFKFGEEYGYGDSYLEFIFCHSEMFRPHATLHDDARAVPYVVVKTLAAVT